MSRHASAQEAAAAATEPWKNAHLRGVDAARGGMVTNKASITLINVKNPELASIFVSPPVLT